MDALLDPEGFANAWAAAWNVKDIEAVLAHFSEDVRFTSPKAEAIAGVRELVGKPALRAYWARACELIGEIEFEIERVVADRERRSLLVVYKGRLDERRFRAGELLSFDAAGRVVRGDALYGGTL